MDGTNALSPERGSLIWDIENEEKLLCYKEMYKVKVYKKKTYKLINS